MSGSTLAIRTNIASATTQTTTPIAAAQTVATVKINAAASNPVSNSNVVDPKSWTKKTSFLDGGRH